MVNEKPLEKVSEQVAAHMLKHDQAALRLGIHLDLIKPGFARMSLKITKDMLNGLGICHGGITYTLADTAFAYACNSRNIKTVALNCSINYSAAVSNGDTLTAMAKERSLNGKTGIYDVTVANQDGQIVAHFRGTSYSTKEVVLKI